MGFGGGGTNASAEPRWLWGHDFKVTETETVLGGDDITRSVTEGGAFTRWIMGGVGTEYEDSTGLIDDGAAGHYYLENSLRALMATEANRVYDAAGGELVSAAAGKAADTYGSLANVVNRYKDWVRNESAVRSGNDGRNDWDRFMDKVVGYVSSDLKSSGNIFNDEGSTIQGALTALITQAVTDAISKTNSPIKDALSVLRHETRGVKPYLAQLASRADDQADAMLEDGVNKISTTPATALEAAKVEAQDIGTSLFDVGTGMVIQSGSNANTQGDTLEAQSEENVTAILGTLTSGFMFNLMEAVDGAVESAQAQAVALVDNATINSAVDSFETKLKPTYFRALNRQAGGFADINAVNTSTFILAGANLEQAYVDEVGDYRAKLNLEVYNRVLPIYMQTFVNVFQVSMGAYLQNFNTYIDTYKSVLGQAITTYLTGLSEHVRTYMGMLGEYARTYNTELGVGGQVGSVALNEAMGTFNNVFQTQAKGYLGELLQRKQLETSFEDHAVSVMTNTMFQLGANELRSFQAYKDYYDTRIELYRQEAMDDFAVQEKKVYWDIDAFTRGANVLAAAGSGIGYTTEGPSRAQRVGSGAAMGAGAALALSSIPGVNLGVMGIAGLAALGGAVGLLD